MKSYSGRDDVTITYGDTDGCINILIFTSLGETLRLWKTQPSMANMPSVHLDKALESSNLKFFKWKAHNDWVEQIRIDKRLNQIISCSNDESHAVIIGCILPSTDVTLVNTASTAHQHTTTNNEQQQQQPHTATNFVHHGSNNASISVQLAAQAAAGGLNGSFGSSSNDQQQQQQQQPPQTTATSVSKQRSQQQQQQQSHNNTNTYNNNNATSSRTNSPSKDQAHPMSTSSLSLHNVTNKELRRRPEANETVFKVNKGVKTFDFSLEKNLLITGG